MVAEPLPRLELAEYHPIIREMPSEERPRERLRRNGAGQLSNAELLAILLRTGSAGENVVALAQRLLARFEGVSGLGRVSFGELCAEKHVGEAKAAQVLAGIELGRRIVSAQPDQRTVIRSPEDVYALVGAEMALLEQEHLRVLLLNTRNQIVAVKPLYIGSVHTTVVRPAEVFRDAVREGAPSVIVVHNHPSGDPSPSGPDIAMTRRLVEVGRMLEIELLDHIVIGRSGPASIKNLGTGFGRD